MAESDSSNNTADFDSDGIIKCASPPKSLQKVIPKRVKIRQSSNASSDSDSSDEPDSSSSRSASPKRSSVEFNQFGHYDESDEEDYKYCTEIAHSQQITLKIQYCCWTIRRFSTCKLNKKGYINSHIYSAGIMNELQWFFRVERYKQGNEVYYGVYVRVITYENSEAKIEFRGYITELRGHSYKLSPSSSFPQKEGFQFLGFLCKSRIRDDDYWYYRMIPDDDLTLSFRIHVQFKKFRNQLVDNFKELWKTNKYSDFTIVAKKQEFPVHKAILAARSPIFAKIFEDKDRTKLEIDDLQPEMVKELLRYIYTGRLKKLLKFLKDFSIAANEYQLNELKSICEKVTESYT